MTTRTPAPGRILATGVSLAAAISVPLALVACDDTEFNSGHSTTVEGEGYDAVVEVFDGNCISCHSAAAALGQLDLETDPCGALVDVESPNPGYDGAMLVASGDSDASVLWHKVANTGTYGDVMPTAGVMDQANIDIITDWIDSGASCDSSGGGDDGGDDGDDDDTGTPTTWQGEYTLANVQAEIFDASCVGCHTDGGVYGALPLTSDVAYANIVDQASSAGPDYVEPSDPSSSYLYLKMTDDSSINGDVMPTNGALDAQYLDLMSGWIAAGAPE